MKKFNFDVKGIGKLVIGAGAGWVGNKGVDLTLNLIKKDLNPNLRGAVKIVAGAVLPGMIAAKSEEVKTAGVIVVYEGVKEIVETNMPGVNDAVNGLFGITPTVTDSFVSEVTDEAPEMLS